MTNTQNIHRGKKTTWMIQCTCLWINSEKCSHIHITRIMYTCEIHRIAQHTQSTYLRSTQFYMNDNPVQHTSSHVRDYSIQMQLSEWFSFVFHFHNVNFHPDIVDRWLNWPLTEKKFRPFASYTYYPNTICTQILIFQLENFIYLFLVSLIKRSIISV